MGESVNRTKPKKAGDQVNGKKAIVFHQGALGDFIVAAAAVDELAEAEGFTRIDFWSKPEHVALLAGKSYLGDCLPCDSPLAAALLHDSLWRTAVLPDLLLEADRVFLFGQTGSRLIAQRLSELLCADVSWIQSFPLTKDDPEHVSVFLRNQFAGLGLEIAGRPLALSPPPSEKRAAKRLLGHLGIDSTPILMHPGSGGKRKVWPFANWHGLIEWIRREMSSQVILSIGPADEYMNEFAREMRRAGVPVVSGLTPLRLAALLSLCGLYIGSDSGVSHLAGAVGIPAIAVFGPTDPAVWAPRGSGAIAVRRTWNEEEILRWAPTEKPDFQDEQITEIIKRETNLTADGRRWTQM
ncbi:MAG: glycosyltransferase family 9 protein [Syntrophobacteraceae bacterium]|nr:glycosyltransferase family 9 protein [Syntrophobacteraceae bacterium]